MRFQEAGLKEKVGDIVASGLEHVVFAVIDGCGKEAVVIEDF